ncbi:DUF4192 family protein [Pseudoclavibacter chungangensis]|uniref:DUF4192 family protein n=1 Tax=Pseudoclavibacter chungangensis TaxID=587635 RepID=A0A7J5BSV7_9MICO|nr:DUF4192 family protein [Pseudoclavibacter chungangensis]KAB1657312.1 DUF4192 family protein [Pseudoclavibacter chungangensis]NYJ66238.1 hypothetical protein [Pseudoclavibacter chungangensis]
MSNHRLLAPGDLLVAVDTVIGAPPSRSLVLLPVTGGHAPAIIRIDLPPDHAHPDATALRAYVSNALGYVLRVPGTTAVVAAVYRDRPSGDDGRLVRALARAAHRAGTPLLAAVWRSTDAWGVHDVGTSIERSHRGHDGRAARSSVGPVGEPGVAAEPVVFADARRIDAPEARPAVERRAFELAFADAEHIDDRRGVVRAWERLLAGTARPSSADGDDRCVTATARDRVTILQQLRSTTGRERLLAAAAFGPDGPNDLGGVWDALFVDGSPVPGVPGAVPVPDHRRLLAARDALETLRGLAPARRGDLTACLGWLAWAGGNSSKAAGYAALAIDHDPLHDLGALVHWMTGRGVVAPWFGLPM